MHLYGINILEAFYTCYYRNLDRMQNDMEWMKNEWFLEDHWDLQILFGEREYEEERWD